MNKTKHYYVKRKEKRKTGLAVKLILCFAMVLILAMTIQALINYYNSYRIIVEQIEASNTKTLRSIQEEINSNVMQIKRNVFDIYSEQEFMQDLKEGLPISDMKYRYKKLAHTFCVNHFSWKEDGVVAIYIYDSNHNCISYHRHSDTPKYNYPKDIYDDEERNNATIVRQYVDSDEKKPLISSYYNEARECNIFRFVNKIFTDNGTRQIGYFICDIEEKVFSEIVEKHSYYDGQVIYLQPKGDRVALTYGNAKEMQQEQLNRIASCVENGEDWKGQFRKNGKLFMEENSKNNLLVYPWVKEKLTERVIGTLKEYGFEYIKMDYNDSIGTGCDGAESLGEGLRQNMEASAQFIDSIRENIPNIIIENCASGGHKLEPLMMSKCSMASFSDAHECEEIPVIAANLHRTILPCQSQIWCVIRETDSLQRIAYSITATFLGRMCISGDVLHLSAEKWKLIEEGIQFYKRISPVIKDGVTTYYGEIGQSYRHLKGWQAIFREEHEKYGYLVLHTFHGNHDSIEIDLPGQYEIVDWYGDRKPIVSLYERKLSIWVEEDCWATALLLQRT